MHKTTSPACVKARDVISFDTGFMDNLKLVEVSILANNG